MSIFLLALVAIGASIYLFRRINDLEIKNRRLEADVAVLSASTDSSAWRGSFSFRFDDDYQLVVSLNSASSEIKRAKVVARVMPNSPPKPVAYRVFFDLDADSLQRFSEL
jgi:hypothetical protein